MEKEVILITGSSGRIGSRLIERIGMGQEGNRPPQQPIGLDARIERVLSPSCECIYVDITSDESVAEAFARVRYAYGDHIAAIIHLAAYYSFSGAHLELYEKITVEGTQRLLRAAQKFTVDLFLFTSTMLVYEPRPRGVIQQEESPVFPSWHYPASKLKTEKIIREAHGTIPYVILRAAGCYDEACNCIPLSQHMLRIYEKQLASVVFPGKSTHGVPYIHFDDLTDLILLLVAKRKELPKELLLLCCEEDSMSYRELQTMLGRLLHGARSWPMWWVPKWFAFIISWLQNHLPFLPKPFIKPWMIRFADDNYQFSMDKARRLLNWSPSRSLRKLLPEIVATMLRDPLSWYKRHQIPLSRYVKKQAQERRK